MKNIKYVYMSLPFICFHFPGGEINYNDGSDILLGLSLFKIDSMFILTKRKV